uniref:Uncharacterized protein n=1 Tax=Arundo donax TaxID=35708 RepID=A0A0A9FMM7_ARUDO
MYATNTKSDDSMNRSELKSDESINRSYQVGRFHRILMPPSQTIP